MRFHPISMYCSFLTHLVFIAIICMLFLVILHLFKRKLHCSPIFTLDVSTSWMASGAAAAVRCRFVCCCSVLFLLVSPVCCLSDCSLHLLILVVVLVLHTHIYPGPALVFGLVACLPYLLYFSVRFVRYIRGRHSQSTAGLPVMP